MKKQPTFAEIEILGVLWESDQATVREVFEIISLERKITYTTILKTMQIMLEKDFLERDSTGKSHVFTAKISKENVIIQLLNKVFRGSNSLQIINTIISAKQTSPEEIKEIRKAIKSKKVKKAKVEKVKK